MTAHTGSYIERAAGTNRDWSDDHLSIVKFHKANCGILTQRHLITDLQQIPPTLQEINATMNVNSAPYACPESPQYPLLKYSPDQQPPRNESHRFLNHPIANVEAPQNRRTSRLIAAD